MQVAYTDVGIKCFNAYANYVQLDRVNRSGFVLWGTFGSTNLHPFDYNRKQSVLEHCAGMNFLVTMLPLFYPGIYPVEDSWNYQVATILHEMGELKSGDIPADGTRNDTIADLKELNYLTEYVKYVPKKHRDPILNIFKETQQKSTSFGKNMYLIDKFDAILRGFVYELGGKKGSILKKPYRTIIDLEAFRHTGVTNTPDNWLYILLAEINADDYPNLPIFLELCQSAAVRVRGRPMEWLKRI